MTVETAEPVQAEQTTETEAPEASSKGNGEAAKYRVRLRETEAQLAEAATNAEALTGKMADLSKAFIEKLAGSDLVDPADLWRYGADPASMLTEDGLPDPEKVQEAVKAITVERPHLSRPRTPRPDPSQGARGIAPTTSKDPFGDALNKALRG